jgi:hypothetical protein
MAVVGTAFAVGGGSLSLSAGDPSELDTSTTNTSSRTAAATQDEVSTATEARRGEVVSRSDRRDAADPLKETTLSQGEDNSMSRSEDLSDEDPRLIAQALLAEFGWSGDQFGCLDALWTRESNWRVSAANSSSGAYGIPQSLPGSKMATVAPDWRTNPITQIRWGLGYIEDRYGSPCGAWSHSQGHGWY